MGITVSGDGLKLAIEEGLAEMEAQGVDGFEYTIGTIRGMKARLVVEPEGTCDIVSIDGPLRYTAIVEN